MESAEKCAVCARRLEERPEGAAGRPSAYCSTSCRRLREYEIRRICRRIDKLEIEERELAAGDAGDHGLFSSRVPGRLRVVRRWRREDERRLRALLEAGAE